MKRIAGIWLWLSHLPLVLRVIALLASVLSILVIAFLCVDLIGGVVIFFPSLHTKEVAIDIGDGWINVELSSIPRTNYVTFKVTNVGNETHMFVVVETTLPSNKLPVENDQVRSYAYVDEPEWFAAVHHQVGFKAGEIPPELSPPPPEPMEGVLIAPSETTVVERWGSYMQRFESGTVLVLFCNCPGHYERGEYTTLTIR
jgi:hypothetical protein